MCRCGNEVEHDQVYVCECGRIYMTNENETTQIGWQGGIRENIQSNVKGKDNKADSVQNPS